MTFNVNVKVLTVLPVPSVGTVDVPLALPVIVTVTVEAPVGVLKLFELPHPHKDVTASRLIRPIMQHKATLEIWNFLRDRRRPNKRNPPTGSSQAATVVAGAESVVSVSVTV
jgi:hypothetical protein